MGKPYIHKEDDSKQDTLSLEIGQVSANKQTQENSEYEKTYETSFKNQKKSSEKLFYVSNGLTR